MAGLGPEALPDYRAATLMIIGQLSARAALGTDLVTGVSVFEGCVDGAGLRLRGPARACDLAAGFRPRVMRQEATTLMPRLAGDEKL